MQAALTIGAMVKHMPDTLFSGVAGRKGVRLFPKGHGLVVYPEMASHADTPECKGRFSDECTPVWLVVNGWSHTISSRSKHKHLGVSI